MGFTGIPADGFQFLMEIRFNNNRQWFDQNRERFQTSLRDPLYALATELAPTAQAIDPQFEVRPNRVVARIYRDARRSKGEFYRDHLWLSFKRQGEANGAALSYYFYLTPEEIGWGLGFYEQSVESMNRFRARVDAKPELFRSIISDPVLRAYKLEGESYAKPKRPGMAEDLALWYNKKSFSTEYIEPVSAAAFSPDLLGRLQRMMLDHKRLYQFVNMMEVQP